MQKIKSEEIKVIYSSLLDGLGYYRHRPGKAPYICLDNSLLLETREQQNQEVYRVLLEYHRSVPLDSIYRAFVIVRYYEDLALFPVVLPVTAPVVAAEPEEPRIEVIGRAIIHRDFRYYEFVHPLPEARVIGQAG